jgi:hypothetical protein
MPGAPAQGFQPGGPNGPGPDGNQGGNQDGGPEGGLDAEDSAAAEAAYQAAIEAGATPEEAFNAAALAATDGNLDDPGVDVARAAFQEALANGATPEEAMKAAEAAARAMEFNQQAEGFGANGPQPDGQFGPNGPGIAEMAGTVMGLNGPMSPSDVSYGMGPSGSFGMGFTESFGMDMGPYGMDMGPYGMDMGPYGMGMGPYGMGMGPYGMGMGPYGMGMGLYGMGPDFYGPYYGDSGPDYDDDYDNYFNTINTFQEVLNATTGNDTLVGGDANTQFTMIYGSTLGGTDSVNGGLGTDEITFGNIDDMQMYYDVANASMSYSTVSASPVVSGSVSLTSVEQLFIGDGETSAVRLNFDGETTGYGFALVGTAAADTLTLADGTTLNKLGVTTADATCIGTIIFGKGGNDILTGSGVEDNIYGGLGDDEINGGAGSDKLYGGDGNDTISGGDGNDVIYGGIGNDIITGGLGIDAVYGDDGDDVFHVVAADLASSGSFNGGIGTDTIQTTEVTLNVASLSLGDVETLKSTNSGGANTFIVNNSQLAGQGNTITNVVAGAAGSTLQSAYGSLNITGMTTLTNVTTLATTAGQGAGTFSLTEAQMGTITTFNSGDASGSVYGIGSFSLEGKSFTNISTVVFDSAGTGGQTLTLSGSLNGLALTSTGSNGLITSTGGLDLTSSTITNVATVTIDSDNNAADTLTLTSATLNGADITGTGGNDLVTSLIGLDLTNVALSNIATVTFDTGGGGADTLTLTGATLNGTDITGSGADDVISAAGSLDLTNVALSNIASVSFGTGTSGSSLTLTGAALNGANISGGTNSTLSCAGDLDLSGTSISNVTSLSFGTAGANTLTVDGTTNLSSLSIAGSGGDDTIQLANGGVTLNLTNNALSAISKVVGGTGNDNITASSSGGSLEGGSGNDTLTAGAAIDTFIYAANQAANGTDTIVGFTTGQDKLDLRAFSTVGTPTQITAAADANADGEVFYLFGLGGATDADSTTSLANAINALNASWTDTAATSMLVVSDTNSSAVYQWTGDGGANGATAGEFTLVSSFDTVLSAPSDIIVDAV